MRSAIASPSAARERASARSSSVGTRTLALRSQNGRKLAAIRNRARGAVARVGQPAEAARDERLDLAELGLPCDRCEPAAHHEQLLREVVEQEVDAAALRLARRPRRVERRHRRVAGVVDEAEARIQVGMLAQWGELERGAEMGGRFGHAARTLGDVRGAAQPCDGAAGDVGVRLAHRRRQAGRLAVVERDELGELVLAARRLLLEPAARGRVVPRPLGARQRAIRDVADEDVAERQLAAGAGAEQVAVHEPIDRGVELPRKPGLERRHRGRGEAAAEHRAELEDATRHRIEGVEPCQHRGLDRVRQARRRARDRRRVAQVDAALDERADDLAGIERIALAASHDHRDELRRRAVEHVLDELLDRARVERLERHRDVVPPAAAPRRAALEELGPGERDHEDRRVAARLQDRLDEVEQAVARPVEVLDQEHERPAARAASTAVRHAAKRAERSTASVSPAPMVAASRSAVSAGSSAPAPVSQSRGTAPDLLGRRVVREVEEAEEERAHRPVREALAVRQALRDGDPRVRGELRDARQELLDEAGSCRCPRAR